MFLSLLSNTFFSSFLSIFPLIVYLFFYLFSSLIFLIYFSCKKNSFQHHFVNRIVGNFFFFYPQCGKVENSKNGLFSLFLLKVIHKIPHFHCGKLILSTNNVGNFFFSFHIFMIFYLQ